MAIPVANASVNPARSLATAVIALGEPLAQVWLFWVAPILGGVAGGLLGRWLLENDHRSMTVGALQNSRSSRGSAPHPVGFSCVFPNMCRANPWLERRGC